MKEIIETYWNVKLLCLLILLFYPRNNRNILECKVRFCDLQSDGRNNEIIETYWNVKFIAPSSKETFLRNNRNILECK